MSRLPPATLKLARHLAGLEINVEEDDEFGCASSEKDFGLGWGFPVGFSFTPCFA